MGVIRSQLDCLILTLPKILPLAPTPGAARLKAIGQSFGYSVQTIDLNIKLWNSSSRFRDLLDPTDTSFFDPVIFPALFKKEFSSFCQAWIDEIAESRPKWVGLSVLSYQSELFAAEFCQMLRRKDPCIRILLGGPGASSFGSRFKDKNWIDVSMVGEAERPFLELLGSAEVSANFEAWSDQSLIADYSDYDLSEYSDELWQNVVPQVGARGAKTLFVTGSTGCVRNCSFCDVRSQWKKFFQRSADDVVNEVSALCTQYKVTNFFFTDSLMNGDKVKFDKFLDLMIQFNSKKSNSEKVTYEGYMICRARRDMNDNYFEKLKKSGLRKIYLGVETGSDKVRADMRKGYSREDLDYFVEQLHRVNIEISLLLMVGFPTETEEDFCETLELLTQYHQKGFLGPHQIMRTASFNWTTIIPENSPLFQKTDEWQIDMKEGESLWVKKNIYLNKKGDSIEEINSPEMRAFRYKRLVRHLEKFGMQLRKVENFLQERENQFLNNKSFFWHLAKANFQKRVSEDIAFMLKSLVVEWAPGALGEKISSMVFVVYWPKNGCLYRLEGLMAELADRIDGRKTVENLIQEVCLWAQVPCGDWENYFIQSLFKSREEGFLKIRDDKPHTDFISTI